jgi:hypothetical protein
MALQPQKTNVKKIETLVVFFIFDVNFAATFSQAFV